MAHTNYNNSTMVADKASLAKAYNNSKSRPKTHADPAFDHASRFDYIRDLIEEQEAQKNRVRLSRARKTDSLRKRGQFLRPEDEIPGMPSTVGEDGADPSDTESAFSCDPESSLDEYSDANWDSDDPAVASSTQDDDEWDDHKPAHGTESSNTDSESDASDNAPGVISADLEENVVEHARYVKEESRHLL
ncbi:hypothetical protein M426DRAFT_9418 [Hypoxylon sp. CI-4A]|nr:hypothetical protein M426DRAFT_9418 [Hypoxylon sp. CI-4A]